VRIYQTSLPVRFDPTISITLEVGGHDDSGELDAPLTDNDLRNYLQQLQVDAIVKVVNETTCEINSLGLYKLRYYCTTDSSGDYEPLLDSFEVSLWVVPS
jgi:hypothetical protein